MQCSGTIVSLWLSSERVQGFCNGRDVIGVAEAGQRLAKHRPNWPAKGFGHRRRDIADRASAHRQDDVAGVLGDEAIPLFRLLQRRLVALQVCDVDVDKIASAIGWSALLHDPHQRLSGRRSSNGAPEKRCPSTRVATLARKPLSWLTAAQASR